MTDVTNGGDNVPVRKQVAKHELLDSGGAVVEQEELATGIRYTLIENDQKFEFQSGLEPGKLLTMLALFGAKTLATNESSQVRNNPKGAGTADEMIEAVRERFALLDSGKWVDRTREGVGAAVDKDALAEAIVRVVESEGKSIDKAKVRAKLEDDRNYVRNSRQHPKVATEYAAIVGKPAKTTDDLIAALA